MKKFLLTAFLAAAGFALFADEAAAQTAAAAAKGPTAAEAMFTVNNIWMLIGTFLVFTMHLGFALLETGLTRAKNCVNILCKNLATPCIGVLTFLIIGFGLMYPGDSWVLGKFLGFAGAGLNCPPGAAGLIEYNGGNYTYWTWGWGGGCLADLNFHDLAGSTFVHSVGGWAALAGVIIIGPRINKFVGGVSMPIKAHNMPLATIGVFLLWLGWFGFNGASAFNADPYLVSYIFVTTTLAACAGCMTAMLTSWALQKKPDLSMMLNGVLAGLVAITASADCVSITNSIVIGAIGGIIVVLAVYMFDRLFLDDPVGALAVHLVNGVWGTLAVGIFSPDYKFLPQLIGVIAVGAACFISASIIFLLLKKFWGLRCSDDEQIRGLDLSEHGMEAYGGFQIFQNE